VLDLMIAGSKPSSLLNFRPIFYFCKKATVKPKLTTIDYNTYVYIVFVFIHGRLQGGVGVGVLPKFCFRIACLI
jgi:hypothetical protein